MASFASKTSEESHLGRLGFDRRNLGAIEFIDLRDNTGIVQLTIPEREQSPGCPERIRDSGQRHRRKKDVPNPKLPTGERRSPRQLAES
jgi:aspartyl-tRNA synthetase